MFPNLTEGAEAPVDLIAEPGADGFVSPERQTYKNKKKEGPKGEQQMYMGSPLGVKQCLPQQLGG